MGDKCVYVHRRLDDMSVFYVGMGTKKRPYKKYGRNKHWKNVANKYGCFIDVLCSELSESDAKELEVFLISEYGLSNLTNYTKGGEGANGHNHTKETKKLLSEIQKGKREGVNNHFYGKKHTEEVKKLISDKQCKKVIDLSNGNIYRSASDASRILGYATSTLTKYLNGTSKNKTTLRYYE